MLNPSRQANNIISELDSNSRKALRYFQKRGCDIYYSREQKCYVRKYFEDGCELVEPLINELRPALDYYIEDFLPSWGKNDWCLGYLESLQHSNSFKGFDVINFIFKDICNLQASDPYVLKELQVENTRRLNLIDSTIGISASQKYRANKYFSENKIIDAKKAAELQAINSTTLHESKLHYVDKRFKPIIEKIDTEISNSHLYGFLRVSSSTRSVMQQRLYKALGYPALDFSFHNLGLAFDLALSHERFRSTNLPEKWNFYVCNLRKRELQVFNGYLKEGVSFSQLFRLYIGNYDKSNCEYTDPKIIKINKLAIQNTPLTLETLIKEGILSSKEPLLQIYQILKKQLHIKVIDETPFFSVKNKAYTDSKENLIRSKFLLPVLHCQFIL